MRTTINIDDALLAEAAKLAGPLDRSAVVHEGLKALIGEIACGNLADRTTVLELLQDLPTAAVAEVEEVLVFMVAAGAMVSYTSVASAARTSSAT